MSDTDHLHELTEVLRSRRLEVDLVEDTLNVSQGTGIMAHKAHLDPRPLLDILSDDEAHRRRQIAAYASGVKHVLLEPARSKAAQWDFIKSAGGLLPGLHVSTFELGVEAAAGESPWTLDFPGDLIVAYFIKLDRGIRVLTAPQVQRWDVSDDRITSAARSLLFHNTRHQTFQPFGDTQSVRRLHAGDGHDAARCLVIADAFYTEIDSGFRFSLPTPDHFLCVFNNNDETMAELSAATKEVYRDADYPLSETLFRFESGRPLPLEETDHE